MIVFLVGAVQFVNILDFMMVAPLGPDFSLALDIPVSHIGYVGGAYTVSASVAGIVGSFFLDRFDRRKALAVALLGLVLGTAAGGFATGFASLVAARLLAGAFGGPATSLAFSIIADVIPPERRGKAMGAVMGAFAVASVAGVPAGLELARLGGWRLPFFAVAGLGLALTAMAFRLLPPLTIHLAVQRNGPGDPGLLHLLRQRTVQISYLMTAVAMMGGFIVIPNIPAYLLQNLNYPRQSLSLLYFVGGLVSFVTTRSGGHLVDRFGSFRVGLLASILLAGILYSGFILPEPPIPLMVLFAGFMLSMGLRNVAYNTLTSKVPSPESRARFMSIQSAVQHFASAAGAFFAAKLLTESADRRLVGMPTVAWIAVGLAVALPPLLRIVEKRVKKGQPAPLPRPMEPETGLGSLGRGITRHGGAADPESRSPSRP